MNKLKLKHEEHMKVYGEGNHLRMTAFLILTISESIMMISSVSDATLLTPRKTSRHQSQNISFVHR